MRVSEVAARYAKALFDLSKDLSKVEEFHQELITVEELFQKDEQLRSFSTSPLVKGTEKEKVLQKAMETAGVSEEVRSFLLLIARKGRLPIIHDVVLAYLAEKDKEAGVIRGQVKTARDLAEKDRKQVQTLLSEVTDSKVILDFDKDETVLGGLTAQVGSLTIDDSIQSHLKRMRDELNRSVH